MKPATSIAALALLASTGAGLARTSTPPDGNPMVRPGTTVGAATEQHRTAKPRFPEWAAGAR
jgi:hypothetical protein